MRISFLMATYNVADHATATIESLEACVRKSDEIIIVDDGSTDHSAAHIRHALDRLNARTGVKVQMVPLGVHTYGGAGIALNIALKKASGDVIYILNPGQALDAAHFTQARRDSETTPSDIVITSIDTDQLDCVDHSHISQSDVFHALAATKINPTSQSFFNKQFLQTHRLSFPEGAYFFEDDLFFSTACQAASTISVCGMPIYQASAPEPNLGHSYTSQTEALTSLADIVHGYERHVTDLNIPALQSHADCWLIRNLDLHFQALPHKDLHQYTPIAAQYLNRIADQIRHPRSVVQFPLRQTLTKVQSCTKTLRDHKAANVASTLHDHYGGAPKHEEKKPPCTHLGIYNRSDIAVSPVSQSPLHATETVLWIGAHKTGTTFLQNCLLSSRQALEKASILSPELLSLRASYIRPLLYGSPNQHVIEIPQTWSQYKKLILFDENIPGLVQDALAETQLYPRAETRVKTIIDFFGLKAPTIVLGIRSLVDFLPSLYCEAMKSTPFIPFEAFLPMEGMQAPHSWSWSAYVCRLQKAFPHARIVVYSADGLRGNESRLLSHLTGCPESAFNRAQQGHRSGFSQRAMDQLMQQYYANGVAQADVKRALEQHPKTQNTPGFSPFSHDMQQRFQAEYQEQKDALEPWFLSLT